MLRPEVAAAMDAIEATPRTTLTAAKMKVHTIKQSLLPTDLAKMQEG